MKYHKYLCFILSLVLMLGLFSGCGSAQPNAEEGVPTQVAEESVPTQVAETLSLEGLDIDSVEYATTWFRMMAGELSEPNEELIYENKYRWYMVSADLNVFIEPDDNAPERMYRIGILNNRTSGSDENAQQFKDLCLAAVSQFTNEDVASWVATFLDVGPVTEGTHPYEGDDSISIEYLPEENRCVLRNTSFDILLEMDTGIVKGFWFVPSELVSHAPVSDTPAPDTPVPDTPVPDTPQSGPLLWEDFLKLLEARFPSYEIEVSPFTDNETLVYLSSGGTHLAQIAVGVRLLDNALLDISVFPKGDVDSEDAVNIICAVCAICDNTIAEEDVQFYLILP